MEMQDIQEDTSAPAEVSRVAARRDLLNTDYLKADLKGRSVRGGAISVASQGCKLVFHTASTVVLARLLTPADFGLIAMVTAVTNFAMMFKDLGLSMATIQQSEINHAQIDTLFWINAAVGLAMAVGVAAAAPAVAWFYGQPELMGVTMALGIPFILAGASVQHQALLRRHMRFFQLGMVEVSAMAISVVAAVISGVMGAGYWSLVVMHITLAASTTIGTWIVFPWRPGRPRRKTGVGKMLGFGGNVTAFNFINYFHRNLDNVLIGRFWGAALLGLYSKAYSLLMLPITQIRTPLNLVALPALSRLQEEPDRFRRFFEKLVFVVAFVSMPLIVYMAVCAQELIIVILGEEWVQAAVIFQILAIAAIIQPVAGLRGAVLISLGQTRRHLMWGIANAILVTISFIAGIKWGPVGVATGYATVGYLTLVPSLLYCFARSPVRTGDFFKAIFLPAVASVGTAAILYAARSLMLGEPAWMIAGLCLLLSVAIYIGIFALLPDGRKKMRELRFLLGLFRFGQVEKVPA